MISDFNQGRPRQLLDSSQHELENSSQSESEIALQLESESPSHLDSGNTSPLEAENLPYSESESDSVIIFGRALSTGSSDSSEMTTTGSDGSSI